MSVLTLPERHPTRCIAAIGVLFALAYALSLVLFPKPDGRVVIGDGLHHYVQLRSAVFDRDLHFQNDYVRMYRLPGPDPETRWVYVDLTETGHVRNVMPVGPALLWAPAFLAVGLGVWVANLIGAGYPLDGYGRLFQATAGVTGAAAAAVGVWLAYRTCNVLFRTRDAVWACITMWLASSALYYSVISPTYSHAASLLATSAFWYVFVRTRHRPDVRRYLVLGSLVGAAALMRWQDAILAVIVGIDLLWRIRERVPLPTLLLWALVSGAAAILVFTPQMLVWETLYGRPFAIPQGGHFMRWTDPALNAVLFSTRRGLFTWTPIVAVTVAGFMPLFRRERLVAVAALTFFGMSWYVNAAVADWWAGEAFGSRRFISCFAVFALAFAALINKWTLSLRTLAFASSAFVGYTLLLLVQYQTFMKGLRHIAPYPDAAYELWLARFRVPFDLAVWWWRS